MNLQFKIESMDEDTMNSVIRQIQELDLDILSSCYLKNGRKLDSWREDANGLRISLNGKLILQVHKTHLSVYLKHVPEEKRALLLSLLKAWGFVKKPDFTLGIILNVIFCFLAFGVIFRTAMPESETLGLAMCIAFGCGVVGLTVIRFSPVMTNRNLLFIVGMTLYFIGVLLFAPSSLLTMPFMKAILQSRSMKALEHVEPYQVASLV